MNRKITLAAILLIASFAAAGCSGAKSGIQPVETAASLAPSASAQAASTSPSVSPSPPASGVAAPASEPSPTAAQQDKSPSSTAASSPAASIPSGQPTADSSVKPATASSTAPAKESTAPTPAPTTSAAPSAAVSVTPAASLKDNSPSPSAALSAEVLYKNNCMACHAANLEGDFGPNLTKVGSRKTKEEIVQQITHGGKEMPPFEKQLSNEQIQALADWLAAKK